jgi:Lar family restriction alleviation protein
MSKLKPCPFCGQEDENDFLRIADGPTKSLQTYCVECQQCETKGPWSFRVIVAMKLWNKRGKK